jgi:hypothetical protein
MLTLTVNFIFNGKPFAAIINVGDNTTLRPVDVIQIIYGQGCKPKPGGTGTTIWKMGKPVGGGILNDTLSLSDNGIHANETVSLVEVIVSSTGTVAPV